MRTTSSGRVFVAVLAVVGAALVVASPRAQGPVKPLVSENFKPAVNRAFGDQNNSWAQSMVWWHDHLYVGTSRQSVCTSLYSLWIFAVHTVSKPFADTYLPYPPNNPDLSCAPDGADLGIQAEIWQWTRQSDTWNRVFQSPLDLDNPGVPGEPVPVGKKLPYEIAIRDLVPFTEPNGTEALYALGVNSTIIWDRAQLPPPRILRSTDGTTFTPIPQAPGTFLNTLPFNPDHSSFRAGASYHGKLFVISGPVFGQGSLIASADPAQGNDAWFLASPAGVQFYELAVFNDWLYLGTFDVAGAGYSVVKTRAQGPPPYQFVTVVPPGAFLGPTASRSVVSMHESNGRLFVGTATPTEIIRINPDDTWDLVVGTPRLATLPGGATEWKYPTSGLDAGFGHTLNDHAWQMDDAYHFMYVGTYNATTGYNHDPIFGPLLQHNMGAHLYRTRDSGWYYNPVTTNGFADNQPPDPLGGRFDYGIRTMASTKWGEFLGTANDYNGLMIFRATTRGNSKPDYPERVEVEPDTFGRPLLSWEGVPGAKSYHIFRALVQRILVRDNLSISGWNFEIGNKIDDRFVGPYAEVGTSTTTRFTDTTAVAGAKYMYYVESDRNHDNSEPSNLMAFPVLNPPMTFARLLNEVDRIYQRQRFQTNGKLNKVRQPVVDAQALAANCQISKAIQALKAVNPPSNVLEPEATDLQILFGKMVRRLTLYSQSPQEVVSTEFCIN